MRMWWSHVDQMIKLIAAGVGKCRRIPSEGNKCEGVKHWSLSIRKISMWIMTWWNQERTIKCCKKVKIVF